jgi:hypothetical protein
MPISTTPFARCVQGVGPTSARHGPADRARLRRRGPVLLARHSNAGSCSAGRGIDPDREVPSTPVVRSRCSRRRACTVAPVDLPRRSSGRPVLPACATRTAAETGVRLMSLSIFVFEVPGTRPGRRSPTARRSFERFSAGSPGRGFGRVRHVTLGGRNPPCRSRAAATDAHPARHVAAPAASEGPSGPSPGGKARRVLTRSLRSAPARFARGASRASGEVPRRVVGVAETASSREFAQRREAFLFRGMLWPHVDQTPE